MVKLKELEKWMSTGQATKVLGFSRPSTIALARSGKVKAVKTACGWLYDPESIKAFAESTKEDR